MIETTDDVTSLGTNRMKLQCSITTVKIGTTTSGVDPLQPSALPVCLVLQSPFHVTPYFFLTLISRLIFYFFYR